MTEPRNKKGLEIAALRPRNLESARPPVPIERQGKLVGCVKLADVQSKGTVRLEHPPFDILVAWADGQIFALEDACNHAGASLTEGWLEETCIVCPMHGYVFELGTGKLLRPRGLCSDQRTYRARIEGDDVMIYDDFTLVVL